MRIELLPCPFCGSTPTRVENADEHWIWCPECDASGGAFPGLGDEAEKAWNKRHNATLPMFGGTE